MPTPKNGFQILNLHPKNIDFKKIPFFMYFCLSFTVYSHYRFILTAKNVPIIIILNIYIKCFIGLLYTYASNKPQINV